MSLISKPFTFVDGDPILAGQHNDNYDAIYGAVNGNLDNSNLTASANIALSKLNATTELLIKKASGNALSAGLVADTVGRVSLNNSGLITFGAGSSQDMALKREDANTLAVRDAGDSAYKNLKVAGLTASGALAGTGLTLSSTFSGTSGSFSGSLTAASMSLSAALPVTSGGTGLAAFTTGDLIYCSATNTLSRLPVGSNGQTLQIVAGVPTWTSGANIFVSTDQTITSAGALTIAHGLGYTPRLVWLKLICQTAELNYSAGDELTMVPNYASYGVSIVTDSTNLVIRYGISANVFAILNKSTGASYVITNGNWKVRFYAQ